MAIYEKTLSGQREIQGTQRLLSLRQRQVLIMVDGRRSANELEVALNNPQVIAMLAELEHAGYVVRTDRTDRRVDTPPIAVQSSAAKEHPTETMLTEYQMQAVRTILQDSTDEYLGIMGKALRQQIASAQGSDGLRACISEWHMALRESKSGRDSAHQLMEEVQAILAQAMMDQPKDSITEPA